MTNVNKPFSATRREAAGGGKRLEGFLFGPS